MTTDIATSDWGVIQQQAQALASSSLVPTAYRGKPENVILAALTGKELGWGPTTAMRYIHIIEGKPTLSAEGMLAVVRRQRHSISGGADATTATARGRRFDTGDEMTVTFAMEDARRAGLDRKGVWKQYPASMLWARAVSQLCRMLFPDCLGGVSYVPEELDADEVLTIPAAEPPPLPESPALGSAPERPDEGQGESAAPPASPNPHAEATKSLKAQVSEHHKAEAQQRWKEMGIRRTDDPAFGPEDEEKAAELLMPYLERAEETNG